MSNQKTNRKLVPFALFCFLSHLSPHFLQINTLKIIVRYLLRAQSGSQNCHPCGCLLEFFYQLTLLCDVIFTH